MIFTVSFITNQVITSAGLDKGLFFLLFLLLSTTLLQFGTNAQCVVAHLSDSKLRELKESILFFSNQIFFILIFSRLFWKDKLRKYYGLTNTGKGKQGNISVRKTHRLIQQIAWMSLREDRFKIKVKVAMRKFCNVIFPISCDNATNKRMHTHTYIHGM